MKIKTQPNNYSCGIYSIINSLIVFGDSKTPEEVGEFTSTTKEGTDTPGIYNALDNLGYKYKVYKTRNKNNAWRLVLTNSINYPLILYLDKDHWAVITGRIKNKVILIDSFDTAHIDNKQELLARWSNFGNFLGIKVSF
jgi:ABC-type bacteriocin/lantibiotic exporter with double-glycine peptidase domain